MYDLIEYKYTGVIPKHTVTEKDRNIWKLKILAFKIITGKTDDEIMNIVKDNFKRTYTAAKWTDWDDIENWRQYWYVNKILPNIGELESSSKKLITLELSKHDLNNMK